MGHGVVQKWFLWMLCICIKRSLRPILSEAFSEYLYIYKISVFMSFFIIIWTCESKQILYIMHSKWNHCMQKCILSCHIPNVDLQCTLLSFMWFSSYDIIPLCLADISHIILNLVSFCYSPCTLITFSTALKPSYLLLEPTAYAVALQC